MDRQAAISLAEHHFPNGPEKVAEVLGAKIKYRDINIDGWCIVPPDGSAPSITLGANAPSTRQRFTLAHEVAHLVLGTPPELIARRGRDLYDPKGAEEVAANQLASDLLLPLSRVAPLLTHPIDRRSIARAATSCRVSEVALVLRLVKNAAYFELRSPTVAKLEEDTVAWKVPLGGSLPDNLASNLFRQAEQAGGTCRVKSDRGEPVLVCALNNPTYPVLFYHWLPKKYELIETPAEARQRLESQLFTDYQHLRPSVSGMFGALKTHTAGLTFDQAVQLFHERYGKRLLDMAPAFYLDSAFHEYVCVRVGEWVPRPNSTMGSLTDEIPF